MSNHVTFIAAILGLPTTWAVQDVCLLNNNTLLDISVCSTPESRFCCPRCGALSSVESESEEIWRHPSFLDKTARIRAHVPYISCPLGCGLQRIAPPWQKPDSQFTQQTE